MNRLPDEYTTTLSGRVVPIKVVELTEREAEAKGFYDNLLDQGLDIVTAIQYAEHEFSDPPLDDEFWEWLQ